MRFAQIIEELTRFLVVEQPLVAYQADPSKAVPADIMAERVRVRFSS